MARNDYYYERSSPAGTVLTTIVVIASLAILALAGWLFFSPRPMGATAPLAAPTAVIAPRAYQADPRPAPQAPAQAAPAQPVIVIATPEPTPVGFGAGSATGGDFGSLNVVQVEQAAQPQAAPMPSINAEQAQTYQARTSNGCAAGQVFYPRSGCHTPGSGGAMPGPAGH